MFKIFFIFFITIFSFAFSDFYIPKSKQEENYLNNLRKEKIKIGLIDESLFNIYTDKDKSLNDIVKEIFVDYLNLNVEFQKNSVQNLNNALENNTLAGAAFYHIDNSLENNFHYSIPIFSEELFIVSNKKYINSVKELKNEKIYSENNGTHLKFFKEILFNNDVNAEIIFVDNLDEFKDEFILTTNPELYESISSIKISNTSDVAFLFNKKYINLIPIVNNLLNEKYKKIILNNFKAFKSNVALNNFYSSLTPEEKNFLKNLKSINVVYDNKNNTLASYFSQLDNTSNGIAPMILNDICQKLGIQVNDLTKCFSNKNELTGLQNGELDVVVLSKTKKREKDFLFSISLFDINMYSITLKNRDKTNYKIGVLKYAIEDQIASRYNLQKNIETFYNFDILVRNLNNNRVGSILTINKKYFNPKIYNVIFFESIPINLGFNKENIMLKNIIDKGLAYLINKQNILIEANLKNDLEDKIVNDRNQQLNIFTFFLVSTLILAIIYINKKLRITRNDKKLLLKDPLTELPNRFVFNEFCKNVGDSLVGRVFVIDLNNFKYINDSLGHDFGDSIIVEFSNFLKKSFDNDYLFRISGDEFYCFVFNSLEIITNRLQNYKEFCPIMVENNIGFSVGLYNKDKNSSILQAFKFADLAMLDAKKNRIDDYKIADNSFVEKKNREIFILNSLKESTSEIFGVFQPKVSLETGKVIGAEVLARYNSNILGYIGPFEFIPIAENNNFIHKIDFAIAEEAIRFVQEIPNFKISFNLSVKTFKRDDLIPILTNLLNKYGISGKDLEIEITESIFITDIQDLIGKLNALKSLGFTISLDDFTAGHSTAGILPILPIDIVKFDKSLLDSLEGTENKGKIIYKNLIALIKDLNLEIVAEGVETLEQVNFLKAEHVHYAQGYFFSKPIDKNELITYINLKK